jgi:hypothetical protein
VVTSLLVDVVSREPLAAADGRSGSLLERVVLADGRALVVKHVLDGGDWIMRATADHGRAAELWSAGVLARVPEVIDHTVVGAEQVPGGWVVIMRDVSAALVPDHARVGRDDSRRVLEAVEVAWYLAINWSRIDATREQVLDDFRAAEGERHDEDALRLALLGGLVQLGWDKAMHASGHPDPAIRAREAADLVWWCDRARDGLGVWSPP